MKRSFEELRLKGLSAKKSREQFGTKKMNVKRAI